MLPAPTAPSERSAGVRDLIRPKASPSSILAHQLRRRFPSQRPEGLIFPNFAPRGEIRPGPLMLRPKTKQPRCFTALLGMTAPLVPLCSPHSEECFVPRRVRRKIISSGASYRLASGSAPKSSSNRLPAEIGLLVTCRPKVACDRRPDHLTTMHLPTSRAKRNIWEQACG